jgi:hypothetical protein
MKKSVLIFLIAFSMWGGVVFAHETTTNGSASVFIHIDPDDNPKPGEPATLFIDVRNKEKDFRSRTAVVSSRSGKRGQSCPPRRSFLQVTRRPMT